jgi:hypothetical protein
MQTAELDSSPFDEQRRIKIFALSPDKSDFEHYCVAVVLGETSEGFLLLCPSSCIPRLGQTFHVKRHGFQRPVAITMSPQLNRVRFQGNDFGFIHQATFQ